MNYFQIVKTKQSTQTKTNRKIMGPIYYHLWGGDKCMYTYMNTGRNIDPCVCIDNLWKDIQETANSD